MAALPLSVASKAYSVQTVTLPVTVSASATQVSLTLTRSSWPAGDVARGRVVWSDGSGDQATLSGGNVTMNGTPITTSMVTVSKPAGITSGTLYVDVLQAFTTAIQAQAQ